MTFDPFNIPGVTDKPVLPHATAASHGGQPPAPPSAPPSAPTPAPVVDETYQSVTPTTPAIDDPALEQFLATLDDQFSYGDERDIRNLFSEGASPPEPPVDPQPVDEPVDEDDEDESPPPPADTLTIGGQPVPRAEVEALYAFGKNLKEVGFTGAPAPAPQAILPPVEPATPPAPPTPPEWLDESDPAQVAFYESQMEMRAQLTALQSRQAEIDRAAQNERITRDVAEGMSSFRAAHPTITDEDETLMRSMAQVYVGPLLSSGITGPAAVQKAMLIAGLELPNVAPKLMGQGANPQTPVPSEVRKRRQSALAHGSGSTSRTPTPARPTSDREMREMLAAGLSESLQS